VNERRTLEKFVESAIIAKEQQNATLSLRIRKACVLIIKYSLEYFKEKSKEFCMKSVAPAKNFSR
jgi:hypothetical protein